MSGKRHVSRWLTFGTRSRGPLGWRIGHRTRAPAPTQDDAIRRAHPLGQGTLDVNYQPEQWLLGRISFGARPTGDKGSAPSLSSSACWAGDRLVPLSLVAWRDRRGGPGTITPHFVCPRKE
jgi:hypothetical protein